MKTKVKSLDASKKQEVKFKCPDCDIRSNSQQGWKVHMKRTHTKYTEKIGPTIVKFAIDGNALSHFYKNSSNLKL